MRCDVSELFHGDVFIIVVVMQLQLVCNETVGQGDAHEAREDSKPAISGDPFFFERQKMLTDLVVHVNKVRVHEIPRKYAEASNLSSCRGAGLSLVALNVGLTGHKGSRSKRPTEKQNFLVVVLVTRTHHINPVNFRLQNQPGPRGCIFHLLSDIGFGEELVSLFDRANESDTSFSSSHNKLYRTETGVRNEQCPILRC